MAARLKRLKRFKHCSMSRPMRRKPSRSNGTRGERTVEESTDFAFSDVTPPEWQGFDVTRGLRQEPTPDRKPLARRWLSRQRTPEPAWVYRDDDAGHE